jgi:uncharacterized protein (TIRG00374 family)
MRSQKVWWGIGFSILLVAFGLYFVDLGKIASELRQVSFQIILAGVGIAIIQQFTFSFRWFYLLKALGLKSLWPAYWSLRMNYFYNLCLPARLGEPYRIYFLFKHTGIKAAQSIGAMAAERFLDFVSLIAVLYLSLFALGLEDQFSIWKVFGGVAIGSLVLLALLKRLPLGSSRPWQKKIESWREQLLEGLRVLTQWRVLWRGLFWTDMSWLSYCLILWILLLHFGESPSIFYCLLILCGVYLASALPASPGQIGTFEAGASVVMVSFMSINLEKAVSIAIVFHIIQSIPTLLIGLIGYYKFLGEKKKKSFADSSERLPSPRPKSQSVEIGAK